MVVPVVVVVVLEAVVGRVGSADRLDLVVLQIAGRHLDLAVRKESERKVLLIAAGCVLLLK